MKVAVTGASGHIGNCLVRELKKRGAEVKVLVHDFKNDLDKLDVEIIQGNLLEPESLKLLCSGADVVFHLAAKITLDNRHPEKVIAVNLTGTKNMIDASLSAGVKKFIHFSSIDAFAKVRPGQILDEKCPLIETRDSIYEITKAESEKLVLNAVNEGLDAIVLCPTAVIGPFDYRGSFLGDALKKIFTNRLPMLIAGGYNWVDVRDVADAAICAVEKGRKGEKYILSGNYADLKALSELAGKITGKKTPTLIAPVFLAKLALPFLWFYYSIFNGKPIYTSQSLNLLINSPKNISFEKAGNELGYNPRPLKQTLNDTFNWYRENKFI